MGLELDLKELKKSAHQTFIISHASILLPFILGSTLALFIFKDTAPAGIGFTNFALFMGVSMSVTAFLYLKTQIGLLDSTQDWLLCLIIILVATIGKLGGTLISAKFLKYSWSQSFTLGILMNTRGLVELIVLNVGLDLGIISPRLFTMLVIMAVVTTFMTGVLLSLTSKITKSLTL